VGRHRTDASTNDDGDVSPRIGRRKVDTFPERKRDVFYDAAPRYFGQGSCRSPDYLVYQGENVMVGIVVGYRKWNAFALSVDPQHHELARAIVVAPVGIDR
jgi:hypothetical protein